MPEPYLVHIDGNDGIGVVDGKMSFPDPDNQPGGTQGFESIASNPVTIADGAGGALTFNTLDGGDHLVDLTAPEAPVVLAAGIYAIVIPVAPDAMTAAGNYDVTVQAQGQASIVQTSAPASADQAAPGVIITVIARLAAGEGWNVNVSNHDGAQSVAFSATFTLVTKLS